MNKIFIKLILMGIGGGIIGYLITTHFPTIDNQLLVDLICFLFGVIMGLIFL